MKGNRRTKKMGMLIGQKRINQYRTNQGGGGMDIATNKKKKKPVQKKMSGGILEYKTKGGGKISTKKSISKIGQKLLGMKNIKRKPVKKKNLGGILGGGLLPVLPATIMGKKPLMKLAESGVGGMLPMAFAKQQSRKKQKADMEAVDEDEGVLYSLGRDERKQEIKDFIDYLTEYIDKHMFTMFKKEKDRKVCDAINVLFKRRENLEIFNKKALYIYIREMTQVDTPVITKVTKILKKKYKELYSEYNEKGYVKI